MMRLTQQLVVTFVVAATCLAQQKVFSDIPVRDLPYFRKNAVPALRELVAEQARVRRNHFYVGRVAALNNGEYVSALVYWKEKNAVVLWEKDKGVNRTGKYDPRYDLSQSRRYWRLNKDIRSSDEPSNWLITKEEARAWRRDCVRRGTLYVISR